MENKKLHEPRRRRSHNSQLVTVFRNIPAIYMIGDGSLRSLCDFLQVVLYMLFSLSRHAMSREQRVAMSRVEAIKRAVTTELQRVPEEAFRGCIEAWKKRMDKCVRLEGNYFEGDKL